MTTLKDQIEKDLTDLKEILYHLDAPSKFDDRLTNLALLITNNPGCFVTLAPTCLKIRSKSNERLAKIDADFNSVANGLGARFIT